MTTGEEQSEVRASIPMVLEAGYASWAARDLAATLATFAPDVVFAIHLPPDVAPFVGEVQGRNHLAPRLKAILDDFDFIEYVPLQITAEGGSFHSRVRFHYRHKETGHEYEGTMRHVWRVEGEDRALRGVPRRRACAHFFPAARAGKGRACQPLVGLEAPARLTQARHGS